MKRKRRRPSVCITHTWPNRETTYNLKLVIAILGAGPMIQAMRAA